MGNRLEKAVGNRAEQLIRHTLLSEDFLTFLKKNMEPIERMKTYYRCAIMEIETKFRVLDEEFSLQYDRNPIENISSRIKSDESLLRKMRLKNIPLDTKAIEENIKDIAGVRVVCSFPEDIYMLADCFLKQDDITLIQMKDYIKNPKASGYRSLHLIVEVPIFLHNEKRSMTVEVQLRTIAMDFWASVEHKLRYKKYIPDDQAEEIAGDLSNCAKTSAELDYKMQEIRNRLAQAEAEGDDDETHTADSVGYPQIPPLAKVAKKLIRTNGSNEEKG